MLTTITILINKILSCAIFLILFWQMTIFVFRIIFLMSVALHNCTFILYLMVLTHLSYFHGCREIIKFWIFVYIAMTLEEKGHVVEFITEVFSVTRLVKIVKKNLCYNLHQCTDFFGKSFYGNVL